MTVRKGETWGQAGGLPPGGVVVSDDAEARAVVTAARRAGDAVPPLGLLGGDLCRTLGGRGDARRLRTEQRDRLERRVGVGDGPQVDGLAVGGAAGPVRRAVEPTARDG